MLTKIIAIIKEIKTNRLEKLKNKAWEAYVDFRIPESMKVLDTTPEEKIDQQELRNAFAKMIFKILQRKKKVFEKFEGNHFLVKKSKFGKYEVYRGDLKKPFAKIKSIDELNKYNLTLEEIAHIKKLIRRTYKVQLSIFGEYNKKGEYVFAFDFNHSWIARRIQRFILGVKDLENFVQYRNIQKLEGSVPFEITDKKDSFSRSSIETIAELMVGSFPLRGIRKLLFENRLVIKLFGELWLYKLLIKLSGVKSFYAFPIHDPSTGAIIAHVSFSSAMEHSQEYEQWLSQEYTAQFQYIYYKIFLEREEVKEAKEAHDSRIQAEAFFGQANDVYLTFNQEGKIVKVNLKAENWAGWKEGANIDSKAEDMMSMLPPELKRYIEMTINDGSHFFDFSFEMPKIIEGKKDYKEARVKIFPIATRKRGTVGVIIRELNTEK